MKIAMIQSVPYPPEEGIGNYVRNLSQELIDRGHSVKVITRGGLRREKTHVDGLDIVRLPCPPVYPFHVDVHGVPVNRFLSEHADQFDLIHTHTPLTPVIETDHPLISTVHTSIVEDIKYVKGWSLRNAVMRVTWSVSSKRLVANQIDASNRVTTVSKRVSGELDEYYGASDATVVGNGVDADRFTPSGNSKDEYILFTGRLDYPKGVPDLINAAKSVVQGSDVDLIITGKGPKRGQLEDLVNKLGITEHVAFTGYVSQDELVRLYQNAMAYVLPSHYEGLPTVLLEAMACGAPAIATRVGGCPEVIEDGINGILVDPGDKSALSNAIESVVTDRDLRNQLSTNARQTIVEEYTWEKITDRFEREYQLTIEEGLNISE